MLTHVNEGEKVKIEKAEQFIERLNPNHVYDEYLVKRTDEYFKAHESKLNLYSVWTKTAFRVIFTLNTLSKESFLLLNQERDSLTIKQKAELLDCWLPYIHHVLMTPF